MSTEDGMDGTAERAADMLTGYAELVKMTGKYAEVHYIPEIEFIATELRALAAEKPAAPAEPWPCAKLTVAEDGTVTATFYTPGLPPGDHDVWCTPAEISDEEALALWGDEQLVGSLNEIARADAIDRMHRAYARMLAARSAK